MRANCAHPDSKGSHRRGFTLVEMLAVLLILGTATAGLLLSVRQPLAHARLEQAVQQWRSVDHLLREMATETGQVQTLIVDLDSGTLWRQVAGQQVRLASGLCLGTLYGPEQDIEHGRASIPFRVDGSTISYGLRFQSGQQQEAFLWIAGGSGQILARRSSDQILAMWEG